MASTPPILLSSWGAMLSIPVAACLLIGLLAAALRFLHRRKSIGHVRGPPASSTLLGHEYELNQQDQVGDLEDKWLKEYGPTWRIGGTFATDILMTADPKALQHIFHKSAYNYAKRASQNQMSYVLAGPNIAWVQGEDHHRHRKIMNPAFNAGQLRSFLPLFQRITGKLVEKWKTELATANESEMMVNNWLSRTTLDIVGEAAFDYNYNALEDNQESALAKAYHGILKDIEFRLPAATTLFRATWDYVPNSVLKLCRYIPVEPFTRISHLRRTYDNYGTKMLREKRTGNDVGEQTRGKDVMSILIKANASSDAKMRLDDEELMAQMFILTLAGHETTAVSFSFLLYELARHPEYQERMREEIMSARARLSARGGVDFTMEELDNMPLCLNAIKESLRLHPIATGLPRVATKDDVLPLAYPIVSTKGETITEIPISKGQVILTSFYAYNRLPQVWGEDADIFNPDRFSRIDTIGKQTNVGVFANLMTFSAGVRACIGWRFSVIEMQSLAAELIGTFKFSLPTGPNAEKEVQCAPAGTSMVPLIRGKPELGPALRLRVGLAH